jgi:hypothetical protein
MNMTGEVSAGWPAKICANVSGTVTQHLAKRCIGEQDGSVITDGQHGHRHPLQYHQGGQLPQDVHR